jgi:hypothetical protein
MYLNTIECNTKFTLVSTPKIVTYITLIYLNTHVHNNQYEIQSTCQMFLPF